MKGFSGKTAFITGGSSGIGLAIAKRLAASGAHVCIFARTKPRLVYALREIEACRVVSNQKFDFFQLDVSDHLQVKSVMNEAVSGMGVPELLINCAGRAFPHHFEDISHAQFDDTMKINLYGIWNTVSALAPLMKHRGGDIVNTSSMAGFLGVFGYADYSASKFAVIGFSEAIRSELKSHGINVQVLCPPDTDTPGFQVENITKPEETRAISEGARIMKPDEIASALLNKIGTGPFIIVPSFDGKVTFLMKRLVPGLVEWIIDRQISNVRARRI